MRGIKHTARRYGYKIKQRFRQDPFSAVILYSVLLSIFFLVFAFRGLIAAIFIKPLGIVNPSIRNAVQEEAPPQVTPEDATEAPTDTEPEVTLKSSGTYTVKEGDTLSSIASSLQLEWQKIAELNDVKPPYALTVGQLLKLPAKE